jgi:hypothetical protein
VTEKVQIRTPGLLRFAEHSMPIYKTTSSSVEEIGADPSGIAIPDQVFNRAEKIIRGECRWSADHSPLIYEVLVNTSVRRSLMTQCTISFGTEGAQKLGDRHALRQLEPVVGHRGSPSSGELRSRTQWFTGQAC